MTLRRVGFVKEVGFKPGVKEREGVIDEQRRVKLVAATGSSLRTANSS